MREESASPDVAIAGIAARQHGVVAIYQLHAAGFEKSAISRRVRAGRLHRLHRGVYAVGHRGVSREGRWMAAVLACGPGAVLSHRSAAALWRMLPDAPGPIDVSVPTQGGRRKQAGIRLHRCASLGPTLTTQRLRIPVTRPARTIADLRRAASASEVRRAIRQAEVIGLALGPAADNDGTRSELERMFLRLCRRQGLPTPEVNVPVGRWTVDFLWRDQQVVAETDGYRYHRGSGAFESDHTRDVDLRRHGLAVHRFTYRQVRDEPDRVISDLRQGLEKPEGDEESGAQSSAA